MENNTDSDLQIIHYKRKIKPSLIGADPKHLTKLMSLTYLWMVFGLFITTITALFVYKVDSIQYFILGSKPVFYSIILCELLAIMTFSAISKTCNKSTAFFIYLTYSILSGSTLSIIFIVFQLPSIIYTFVSTIIAFLGLSAYGFLTKRNLEFLGSFCLTGLVGLLGLGICFLLFPELNSNTANLCWSAAGVIVFSGLIAFDTQKLKEMLIASENLNPNSGTINAALFLYLDFINLFLDLLNLFGSKK